ncbi:hypothetical protein VPH35_094853 [Triticum aestivum]|uniref:Late embryogenesis abundant protein LEA-2 subgroup domain-containing protein n=2 Tax=Aegilops tauschii TaxID=37682 RepID=A0A453JF70_AEGTS
MPIHTPSRNKWSAKRIVLVAMLGTLVAVAVAAVVSMSLSPPHIYFSVEDATIQPAPSNGQNLYAFYNFTLVANNTSRRSSVHYSALSAEIWQNVTLWFPAEVDTPAVVGKQQPPGGLTRVRGWAEFYEYDRATKPSDIVVGDWPNSTVVVVAKVWFKFSLARTRPYNVRVTCAPVNFRDKTTYTACMD